MDRIAVLNIQNEKGDIILHFSFIIKVHSSDNKDNKLFLLDEMRTDSSSEVRHKLSEMEEGILEEHHKINLGKSYIIWTGFRDAEEDIDQTWGDLKFTRRLIEWGSKVGIKGWLGRSVSWNRCNNELPLIVDSEIPTVRSTTTLMISSSMAFSENRSNLSIVAQRR